jgi:hypothetical protein
VPDEKKVFPNIPARNWWEIRARFQRSLPRKVDADYLQSILGLGSPGAAANVVASLRAVGLIDDGGSPTELAKDWRADEQYGAVCAAIRENLYPDALLTAFPPPDPDLAGVRSWFARNAEVGEAAARKMAAFYGLLAEANPSPAENPRARAVQAPKARPPAKQASRVAATAKPVVRQSPSAPETATPSEASPALHIDIQVHIPSTATPEQVDAIFSSMARHLYRKQ